MVLVSMSACFLIFISEIRRKVSDQELYFFCTVYSLYGFFGGVFSYLFSDGVTVDPWCMAPTYPCHKERIFNHSCTGSSAHVLLFSPAVLAVKTSL